MYNELQKLIPMKNTINSILSDIAAENNVEFWDYSMDTLSYFRKYFFDSMHLNKNGAEIFTAGIAKRLVSYIKRNNIVKSPKKFLIHK